MFWQSTDRILAARWVSGQNYTSLAISQPMNAASYSWWQCRSLLTFYFANFREWQIKRFNSIQQVVRCCYLQLKIIQAPCPACTTANPSHPVILDDKSASLNSRTDMKYAHRQWAATPLRVMIQRGCNCLASEKEDDTIMTAGRTMSYERARRQKNKRGPQTRTIS